MPRQAPTAHPALPPPPPPRRLLAWLYTGPLGHLWSTGADIVTAWAKWAAASVRERYSKR